MAEAIDVGLVALGGYARFYLDRLLDRSEDFGVRLVAAVDPSPERCERFGELRSRGVPVYPDLDKMLEHHQPQLVIISSPIHFHAAQAIRSMEGGADVLCEKPVAATVQEALAMRRASEKTGRFCAIGFQWSFSEAVNKLKNDIAAGTFGTPRRFKTLVFWPRPESYYRRSDWAGKLRMPGGRWVLDSPANNATAHYWHNMLYLAGAAPNEAAELRTVEAELYRAKPIENFDTAAIRCQTRGGLEVLFYTSHSTVGQLDPISLFEFSGAVVHYSKIDGFTAKFVDGEVRRYGDPEADHGDLKLRLAADAVRGGAPVSCDVNTATPQLIGVNAAQESCSDIVDIPDNLRRVRELDGGDRLVFAEGLDAVLLQCYSLGVLPSELGGLPWVKPGKTVNVESYERFPAN